MKSTFILALALSTALAGACSKSETETAATSDVKSTEVAAQATKDAGHELTPEQLGELGARIEKTPDDAEKLLSEHGLDEKSFEKQIRKVTESPEASKRYADAYKKAKA